VTARKLIRQKLSTASKLRVHRWLEFVIPNLWMDSVMQWLRESLSSRFEYKYKEFKFKLKKAPEEFLAHTGNGQKIDLYIDWSHSKLNQKLESLQVREIIARHFAVRTIVCAYSDYDDFTYSVLPLNLIEIDSEIGNGVFFDLSTETFESISNKLPIFQDILILSSGADWAGGLSCQDLISKLEEFINFKTFTFIQVERSRNFENLFKQTMTNSSSSLNEDGIRAIWGNIMSEFSAKISE